MAVLSLFANPHRFMAISKPFAWGFTMLGGGMILYGVYMGLFVAPADVRQGDAARIMFVHVPSMWLSMFAFAFMAGASFVSLIWRHALADVAAKSAAPIGAVFTALGLITGSIWGYPIWGTWWEWDARITSVLILFFIYLGYLAVWQAMETPQKAARAAAILCLVGAANLPIIHFSVDWWNTLHQPATFFTEDNNAPYGFKVPMYIVALGYLSLFGGLTLINMRAEIMMTRAEMMMQRKLAAG
ncbi:MAG: heme ABC transporter permease [Alphaproteobacteria bacterium]|nr:heme ABC transporter permease [Alphaproteobacteria bacterium]